MKRIVVVLPAMLLLSLGACGPGSSSKSAEHAADTSLPEAKIDSANAGSLTGTVYFKGNQPEMPVIDMSSNPQCERQHKTPQKAEIIVVNDNRTLRNVFVYISEGLPRVKWPVPHQSAKLDQTGCMYSPHVLGIEEGQQLEILNSDPVNHNVHAEAKVNSAWNESQPPRAEHKFKQFNAEEVLFPVTCSVHPWMRAYIGVVRHPFFAVTGADGSFSIANVPPGTYTVEAVHEKFGKMRGRAVVNAHTMATVDFSYGN